MTKQIFINRVLAVLNEADANEAGAVLVGADTAQIPNYIEQLYPMAWRRAVDRFPRSWFKTRSFADSEHIVAPKDGIGFVVLPEDFLLLSSFKMRGWKTACLTAPEETPEINNKQRNEFTRGTPQRPVCVRRPSPHQTSPTKGRLTEVLWYYSLPKSVDADTHKIEHALYIPNVRELSDHPEIDERLFEPLARLAAAEVLASFEKFEFARAMEAGAIGANV